jgi:hypothetical protein
MFFYINNIVFAFTTFRKKDAKNLIRRLKNIFDVRDINSLNFFLDMRIWQKLDTIWSIQNFYMNKLINNYVINIEYKATTFLSYQSLMSYIDEINQKRIHIYRQKIESICYFVIITRSNIIKTAFELTRHYAAVWFRVQTKPVELVQVWFRFRFGFWRPWNHTRIEPIDSGRTGSDPKEKSK